MAKTRIMIKLSNGKYIDMSKAKTIKPEDKVHKVMREFKEGKLKSSSGQIVTSRDQALAIAMSESGLSKNMIHDIAIEYDSMEKARVTKYIKRVPKPSGKGYYYFYTREQVKEFQEKGIVPKEEKGGNFWDKVKSFFGNNADEKVNKLHEIVSGAGISVTKDSLAEHLAEYLSNKDKWDAKFRGEKKEKGETKPKTEYAKSEKKESTEKKEGGKWNTNLMKFFSNQYGMIGALKKEEVKKEGFNPDVPEKFSKDYEKFAEGVKSDIKKNKNLSGYYLERLQKDIKQSEQRIKSIKKEAQSTGEDFTGAISKFEERIKDASILSKQIKEITGEYKTGDNFETMPEGEDKYKKIASHKDWVSGATITESRKENGDTRFVATIKGWRNFPIYEGKPGDEISKKVQEKVREIRDKLKSGDESILNENTSINQKPSATEALKTFTIVDNNNPERTVKVQAKDENEAKDKGASELKTTNIRTYESSSKVEALKEELGKKKGESKEREITVFGKQQKVKTKPIELNLGYEHPFEIAKRDFGNNRSDWVILESSTGLKVGDGKTQKDAIENAETMIKKYTKSESEFKRLVEKNNPENIEKKDNKPEQEARKQVEKDFEDKSSKGQASIKKMEDEEKKKKEHEANLQSKDPQVKYDIAKQIISDFENEEKKDLYSDQEWNEYIKDQKETFNNDLKEYKQDKRDKTKFGHYYDEAVDGLKKIKEYENSINNLSKLKEDAIDASGQGKMFKALSNLRQEIMFKAQPTKYIKRISNPNGKGYIYFYTQAQVKEYEKTGKIPDDQKKKPEVKEKTGKGNIEILKESIKKVASIFADALSAKDAVQPTGQGVEQTGENIAQKSKDKKRLEKQRDIRKNTKKNTPEEKPTK